MRKEVIEFAEEMERVLQKHDTKKGDSWKALPLYSLQKKLMEEYKEAIGRETPSEFVDVANVCLMLWHRTKTSTSSSPSR